MPRSAVAVRAGLMASVAAGFLLLAPVVGTVACPSAIMARAEPAATAGAATGTQDDLPVATAPAVAAEGGMADVEHEPEVDAVVEAGGDLEGGQLAATDDALSVFERHCAQCHQAHAGDETKVQGGFGHVLDLRAIAQNPDLVRPGRPDASALYNLMLSRAMPPPQERLVRDGADVRRALARGPVTTSELMAVRRWIAGLPQDVGALGCDGREAIAPETAAQRMRAYIARNPQAASDLRFVSLVHLHNGCASTAALAAYRQAVGLLLNSLSWKADPARIEAIDASGTILAVRLSHLAWVPSHWELLVGAYPYAGIAGLDLAGSLARATGTRTPSLAADWLVAEALQPARYYELLGLSDRVEGLEQLLEVDFDDQLQIRSERRIGVIGSQVAPVNRMIVYREGLHGGIWRAYDFRAQEGRGDLQRHPLGPVQLLPEAEPFRHDAMQVLFTLPNGFKAFAVYDSEGRRLDTVPAGIGRAGEGWGAGELAMRSGAGGNDASVGLGCMRCHASGAQAASDGLRAHAQQADSGYSEPLRALIEVLHPDHAEIPFLFASDNADFRKAKQAAGLDPDLRLHGLEPLPALARVYQRSVTLRQAAAELGVDAGSLASRLPQVTGEGRLLALRLLQNPILRTDAPALYAALAGGPPPSRRLAAQVGPVPGLDGPDRVQSLPPFDLSLVPEKPTWKAGDLLRFSARATRDCRLTIINIGADRMATVLFPNELDTDNALAAGETLTLPRPDAAYQIRLDQPGRERLVGICSVFSIMPSGIATDYEQQRFTVLGDWLAYQEASFQGELVPAFEVRQPSRRRWRRRRVEPYVAMTPIPPPEVRTEIEIIID